MIWWAGMEEWLEPGLCSLFAWFEIMAYQAVWPWANYLTSFDSVSSFVKVELIDTSVCGCDYQMKGSKAYRIEFRKD